MSYFTHLLAFNPLDAHAWLEAMGPWATIGLIAIIFAESGLLIGFFLPGDSILFLAGFFASPAGKEAAHVDLNIWVIIVGCIIAAIAGDQVGYLFGNKVGPSLFTRPDSRFFKQENVARAQKFFDEKGAKTIILARFVPIVRTFTPFVAGMGAMTYRTFIGYSIAAAVIWVSVCVWAGYFFGGLEIVQKNFSLVVLAIIAISVVPMILEVRKARREARAASSAD